MDITTQFQSVRDRVTAAALSCNRDPETVRLVAVSKTIPAERVRQAIDAGAVIFGENYIQEARDKHTALADHPISWHFIGRLQSNKAKYAVRQFDLIHSVDSIKLAGEINRQAQKNGKIQHILIQVNISGESTKSGISTEALPQLVRDVSQMANVSVRGLMTMPPFFDDPERARPVFKSLRILRDSIVQQGIPNVFMEELSMGMTGDFETAIEEGATLVRVGTAIFGSRT